jgi:hypothetical protein
MKNYHMRSDDGKIFNLNEYKEGSFYLDYCLVDGAFSTQKISEPRIRSVEDEEQYRFDLLKNYSSTKKTIMHNHIDPINPEIRQYLMDMAEKNYYLYRKDKRAQLGSYVIAFSTKQFGQLIKGEFTDRVDDIDPKVLDHLVERIKTLDTIIDNIKNPDDVVIAYEDIEFFERDGFPRKQNRDYRVRLSQEMQDLVERLVTEYESSKNS